MTLYIVATPIGNLKDITLRAIETLREVDCIVAEDTRVTRKLLGHYDIKKPLIAFHEYSRARDVSRVVGLLQEGKNVAYVTDAGTPGISDPGGYLVEQVLAQAPEVRIEPIPGPSALVAALSIVGTELHEFLFLGFPPHKKGRKTFFERVAAHEGPVVLYESPHRIVRTLQELSEAGAGMRKSVLAREMTKIHETVLRGSIDDIAKQLGDSRVRGEIVLILTSK